MSKPRLTKLKFDVFNGFNIQSFSLPEGEFKGLFLGNFYFNSHREPPYPGMIVLPNLYLLYRLTDSYFVECLKIDPNGLVSVSELQIYPKVNPPSGIGNDGQLYYHGGQKVLKMYIHRFGWRSITIPPTIDVYETKGSFGLTSLLLRPQGSPPENPSAGEVYFDNNEKWWKAYDGDRWIDLPNRVCYLEHSIPLLSLGYTGTAPQFFATKGTNYVLIDYAMISKSDILNNINTIHGTNIYGDNVNVTIQKAWLEVQFCVTDPNSVGYVQFLDLNDESEIALLSTNSTNKYNRQIADVSAILDKPNDHVFGLRATNTSNNEYIQVISATLRFSIIKSYL